MPKQVKERMYPIRQLRGVFYGWWLVGIAGVLMALGSAPLFQSVPAWFPVLQREFGWSRAKLSWAFSLSRVEGSVSGPLSGYLIDKMGPRHTVLVGMLIFGGGFLLFSQVKHLWQFYVVFLVMTMGSGLGTWIPALTLVNNWFIKRRAMAISISVEGIYLGAILVVPALAWAIDFDHPERPGWRAAAVALGAILILLAVPISRLVRNRPEDYGYRPDGAPIDPAKSSNTEPQMLPGEGEPGYTWKEAVRTRTFWLLSVGHACAACVIVTMLVHLGPIVNIDKGFSLQMVGWLVSTLMAVAAVFTLVGGFVGDRVPLRLALSGFTAMEGIAIIVLLLAPNTATLFLFAVLEGIGFGGRNPLTTAARGAYFGRRAFASLTGTAMIPMNLFLLVFPLFAGYMFDIRGSYTVPFVTVAFVSFTGASLFLLMGEPGRSPSPPRAPREVAR